MNGFTEEFDINENWNLQALENDLDRVDFSIPPEIEDDGMGRNPNMRNNRNPAMPIDYEMDSGEETPLWKTTCLSRLSRSDIDRLRSSIEGEIEGYLYYTELARRFRRPQRERILKIASDELMHSRRFKSAYYIATGRRYNPNVSKPIVPLSLVNAVRESYEDERRDAAKYLRYAEETNDECLSELYTDTAQDEKRHAAFFYRLLATILD